MNNEFQSIVSLLTERWPENRIAPSLRRVSALLDLLGSPQSSAPVVQIAGTNGKGSTAIMIDALFRSMGLRVGRFSSPHLIDVCERISIDSHAIDHQVFVDTWKDIEPYVKMIDDQLIDGVKMTFFEVITCMAYVAFSQAPVDVMVVETGLGGTWDATNVADASVAVICPIDFDHMHILGNTIEEIAAEKAGIIKQGSIAVMAGQRPEAAKILLNRCVNVGATIKREGIDFALLSRTLAVGGQMLRIEKNDGPLGDIFLPVYGEHMGHNAALAVAAVEAFLGDRPLDGEIITQGLAQVSAPARMEVIRRSPTIVLDTAHNPHGVKATMKAMSESFAFDSLIVVVAIMKDKDSTSVLEILSQNATKIVATELSSNSRCLSADELASKAEQWWETEDIYRTYTMEQALDVAVQLADEYGAGAGILVIGSVIATGEARSLLLIAKNNEDYEE